MARIETMDDFTKLTSNITSFSHAYLFNVNSLEKAFPYIKTFAKRIICPNSYKCDCQEKCDICYQIDNDEFDDLYIVNPDTIGINNEEIEKLFQYMETRSLRFNGKRVYIIYGFERLSRNVSNKILKFLEEPSENIYGLLMTENINQILPTIISRCQTLDLSFSLEDVDSKTIENMKEFLKEIVINKEKAIAYANTYWQNYFNSRISFYDAFAQLEKIISFNVNVSCMENFQDNSLYYADFLQNIPIKFLINILNITSKLKNLIKKNINLNLLIDRYIIEVSKELK